MAGITKITPDLFARIQEPTLFLDLGTTFGWAFYNPETKTLLHGFEKLTKPSETMLGLRLHRFGVWLTKKWASWAFKQIVYEEVAGQYKSGAAAKSMHALLGELEKFNYLNESLPETKVVNNNTMKRLLTPKEFKREHANTKKANGKYLENKDFMVKKIQLLGFERVVNNNEADALAVSIIYCSEMLK